MKNIKKIGFLILLIFITGCKAQGKSEKSQIIVKQTDLLSLIIKNSSVEKAIENTILDFDNKFKSLKAKYIILSVGGDGKSISMEARCSSGWDESIFYSVNNILAGCELKGVVVLLEGNNKNYEMYTNYFTISNKPQYLNLTFGGYVNSCLSWFEFNKLDLLEFVKKDCW